MPLTVNRLTPIGASSTWGRAMPGWYWQARNNRQAATHLAGGHAPVEFDECPYNRGTGSRICNLGCWQEPACITDAPGRYGWPRRPLDLHRIRTRLTTRSNRR